MNESLTIRITAEGGLLNTLRARRDLGEIDYGQVLKEGSS